jgi:ketosteroid isomerase-like protein
MPQPESPVSDETAIRAAREAQNRAIDRGEWESVASLWVRDVTVVAGLGVAIQGREAYRAALAADAALRFERIPGSIQVSSRWPLAWEEGTWMGRRTPQDAPLIMGRYSAQWGRVADRWLIRSELFVALTCSGEACRWQVAPPSL